MISANELREKKISNAQNGYSIAQMNDIMDEAADTIEAYTNENKELYHKLEVLAAKIEEYRASEDSIKTALITAQKMADKITGEANESADELLKSSEAQAKQTVDDANAQAEKLVSEARDYAAAIVKEKTDEADSLMASAEKKANDAINSSKIVAQDILDQAKEISDDLINKSKQEQQAYSALVNVLRSDAKAFVEKLKEMYTQQLEVLNSAKLEEALAESARQEVEEIHSEVNSLVDEIDEIESAIPEAVQLSEETEEAVEEAPVAEEAVEEIDEIEEIAVEETEEAVEEEEEIDEEPINPMQAVEAFSQDEITPIDKPAFSFSEIDEDAAMEEPQEASLFDDEAAQRPFESYFNVKKDDVHGDKTQTISLLPPEEDEEDAKEESCFKGCFKKKK